jgi:hypothetical protein
VKVEEEERQRCEERERKYVPDTQDVGTTSSGIT